MAYHFIDGIQFLKSLSDESVDGIFTDPPWGIRVGTHAKGHRSPKLVGAKDWLYLIRAMTEEGRRILKVDGKCLIWLGLRHIGEVLRIVEALEYRWTVFCHYIPPRYIAGFESRLNPILYFARPESPWPGVGRHHRRIHALYNKASTGRRDTKHPCARPAKVVKEILEQWFAPGQYIVDPFAGSDTVGVACRELNLRWDSCEIDPIMYETGIDRHREYELKSPKDFVK